MLSMAARGPHVSALTHGPNGIRDNSPQRIKYDPRLLRHAHPYRFTSYIPVHGGAFESDVLASDARLHATSGRMVRRACI